MNVKQFCKVGEHIGGGEVGKVLENSNRIYLSTSYGFALCFLF